MTAMKQQQTVKAELEKPRKEKKRTSENLKQFNATMQTPARKHASYPYFTRVPLQ